jgi:hypothetical protein
MDVRKTSSDGYFVGFRVSTCVKSGGLLKLKIITTLKDEERKNCLTAELARRKRERENSHEKKKEEEGRRRNPQFLDR